MYRHVIVVDDCSSDPTPMLAANVGATVLPHAVNLGQGAALQTGISYALRHGAAYIATFDADGQHRVEDIGTMFKTLHGSGADVVIGSRFLGHAENLPPLRKRVLHAAAFFMRWSSGLPLTDAHNGLRLLTRRTAERIHISQNRMAHASEIVDQIGQAGLKVVEAPVTVLYTPYSLRKGQKISNSINILVELLAGRLSK